MADSLKPDASPPPDGSPPKQRASWWKRLGDVAFYAAAAFALYALFGPKDSGPEVGQEAEAVLLTKLSDGSKTPLRPEGNRPLLVKAYASWCGACRRSTWIDDLGDVATREGLDFVAVSVDDSIAAAIRARDEWPIEGEVLFDHSGEFSASYDVSLLPTYILIGADGRVQRVTAGLPGPLDLRAWSQAAQSN